MKKLLVAVCILESEGKFPLIKFKRNYLKGYWGLPGGKLDDGEHLPQAAVREIKEELGCDVAYQDFLGVVDEFALQDEGTTRAILLVATVSPVGEGKREKSETDEGTVDWFTADEVKKMKADIVPSDYKIFENIYLGGNNGYYSCQQTIKKGVVTLDYFDRA